MIQCEIKERPWEFFFIALYGSIYLTIGFFAFYISKEWWGLPACFIALKVFFYGPVDFLFCKRIIQKESGLYINVFFLNLPLDIKRSYLVIAPQSFLIRGRKKSYNLVLVRNDNAWFKRLFKNRIKLYPQVWETDLEKEAGNIAQLSGLCYRGIDKSEEGLGYSDNNGDLPVPLKKWRDIREEERRLKNNKMP